MTAPGAFLVFCTVASSCNVTERCGVNISTAAVSSNGLPAGGGAASCNVPVSSCCLRLPSCQKLPACGHYWTSSWNSQMSSVALLNISCLQELQIETTAKKYIPKIMQSFHDYKWTLIFLSWRFQTHFKQISYNRNIIRKL